MVKNPWLGATAVFNCSMIRFNEIPSALLHLFFPHICTGCGSDLLPPTSQLCMRCMAAMPGTRFELFPGNPVEKIFMGRLPLAAATAQFYFTKESLVQRLIHELKYRSNKEIGHQLGTIMGEQLLRSGRFGVDGLVPLPLFPARERKRGYNQARLLCEGISGVLKSDIMDHLIIRPSHTQTQTKKGRIERWLNMDGKFVLTDPGLAKNKHLLLIDDVITTGATLESCGNELLQAENVRLSIAALCVASKI